MESFFSINFLSGFVAGALFSRAIPIISSAFSRFFEDEKATEQHIKEIGNRLRGKLEDRSLDEVEHKHLPVSIGGGYMTIGSYGEFNKRSKSRVTFMDQDEERSVMDFFSRKMIGMRYDIAKVFAANFGFSIRALRRGNNTIDTHDYRQNEPTIGVKVKCESRNGRRYDYCCVENLFIDEIIDLNLGADNLNRRDAIDGQCSLSVPSNSKALKTMQ